MKEIWSYSIVFFVLFAVPITLTASAEVSQVRGELTAELKPGDSTILEWQFTSDDESIVMKLNSLGEVSQFLSFPKEVTLKNGVNTIEVVVNIPNDYSGVDVINGKLMASPGSGSSGITGFLKSVSLSIELPAGLAEQVTVSIPPGVDDLVAEIVTSEGKVNDAMTIDVTITDMDGNAVEHITYNVKATQGSQTLMDEEGHMHMSVMTNTHTTTALDIDASDNMPVNIMVTAVGFGHDDQYQEASGEIATKQVVPEFGTITMMILAISIISIIAMTSKSKMIPRL